MEVIHIDLDETKVIERRTAGWSDEQISNYPMSQLDENINSCEMSIATMKKAIEDQEARIKDFRKIKDRKLELG